MKKMIILFLGLCSLTACATTRRQPTFDWRGQNFDEYVIKKGVPSSQYTLQNGNTVYSFKERCNYTWEAGYMEKSVVVDSNHIIQQISTKNMCYNKPEGN